MEFGENLFEGLASDRKEKQIQYPYSVRRQDILWFLSNDNSNCADNIGVIEQMKYKADYLYSQREYTEAVKSYDQLLMVIPVSNTILTQEVCESKVMCLMRIEKTDEAKKCLEEMITANKMNATSWHIMFTIQRDKGNLKEATYAIQQCVKENEEVSSLWIDLAETYILSSSCFKWPSELTTCKCGKHNRYHEKIHQKLICTLNSNYTELTGEGRGLLDHNLLNSNHMEVQAKENLLDCTAEMFSNQLNEKGRTLCNVEREEIVVKNVLQSTAKNETKQDDITCGLLACSIEDSNVTELHTTIKENSLYIENEELRDFVKNHHYCYFALSSFLISRFLLRKYSTHSQFTKQESQQEKIVKVNFMINSITCATEEIINQVRKLLKIKFAERTKPSHSRKEPGNMFKAEKEFNKRWFPLME